MFTQSKDKGRQGNAEAKEELEKHNGIRWSRCGHNGSPWPLMSLSTSEIATEFHKTTVRHFIKLW